MSQAADTEHSIDNAGNQRPVDHAYLQGLGDYFSESIGSVTDRLRCFAKFVPRADLIKFLALYEIYKRILHVPGAIVECGVHLGGGLMTWAQLSSIFEPINHTRRVVGFDTFAGFPAMSAEDRADDNGWAIPGGLAVDSLSDIERAVALYDMTRPLNHIGRVKLIRGDATKSIPAYLEAHPHTVVSLLHLDFDIYEPTKAAIQALLPRMPRGAIIVFDELDDPRWPGETLAVLDTLKLGTLKIQRFPHQPQLSYVQLGE